MRADKKTIKRKRLLEAAIEHKHLHIGAPAGFGKTVLLSQLMSYYMRSGRGSRERHDFDISLDGVSPLDDAERLMAAHLSGNLLVSVDNLAPAQMDDLLRVVVAMPKNARLFTAGTPLPRSFSNLKISGATGELTMDDMAYSSDELARAAGGIVPDSACGWPIVCSCPAFSDINEFNMSLNSKNGTIRNWMRDNFLGRLDERSAKLLLQASVLDPIVPEILSRLCDIPLVEAVDFLDGLYYSGYPLKLLGEGYGLHSLFAEFLQNELARECDPDSLWSHAASLYEEMGMPVGAARCALKSRDINSLVEMAEKGSLPLLVNIGDRGAHDDIEDRLEKIGSQLPYTREKSARLFIVLAQHLFHARRQKDAISTAELAISLLQKSSDVEGLVQAVVVCSRILRYSASLERAIDLLRQMLSSYPELSQRHKYELVAELATDLSLCGDPECALGELSSLRDAARFEEDENVEALCTRLMTVPYFCVGNYDKAYSCYCATEEISKELRVTLERHEIRLFAARSCFFMGMYEQAEIILADRMSEDEDDFCDNRWLVYYTLFEMEFCRQLRADTRGEKADYSKMVELIRKSAENTAENKRNIYFRSIIEANLEFALLYEKSFVDLPEACRIVQRARKENDAHISLALVSAAEYILRRSKKSEDVIMGISFHRECLALEPSSKATFFCLQSRLRLGLMHLEAGLRDSASQYLVEALEIISETKAVGLLDYFIDPSPLIEFARHSQTGKKNTDLLRRIEERVRHKPKVLRIRVFGKFEVIDIESDAPVALKRKKVRELFAYMLLHSGEGIPRKNIVRDLWPCQPIEKAMQTFYVTLSYLKSELSRIGMDDLIGLRDKGLYDLDSALVSSDCEAIRDYEAKRRLAENIATAAGGDEARNIREEFARNVTSLFGLTLLEDFDSAWVKRERARLRATAKTPC